MLPNASLYLGLAALLSPVPPLFAAASSATYACEAWAWGRLVIPCVAAMQL
jgi:hypothetical protein